VVIADGINADDALTLGERMRRRIADSHAGGNQRRDDQHRHRELRTRCDPGKSVRLVQNG
jgi:hypothetical protein